MNYTLKSSQPENESGGGVVATLRKLFPLLLQEKTGLLMALGAVLINSGLTILAPILIGRAVDTYLLARNYDGIIRYSVILLFVYLGAAMGGYLQTRIMGGVGQRILFRLRGDLFNKLQELPVAFFNQNKAGDLISRINNDTDKLNQFFSRSLVQFVGNVFVIIGAGAAMVLENHKLGSAALLPALGLIIFAQAVSGWIKRSNLASLQALGGLSAEVQESLENFRVIIAFNRRDYFRKRFVEVNTANYGAAIKAGIANTLYVPVFGFASNLGMLIVIVYGLHLISLGELSFGLLISYLAYISRFYDPLRQMATIWSDLQTALAGWNRIGEILSKNSDLHVVPQDDATGKGLMELQNVSFAYPGGNPVLSNVSLTMEKGKTYALVGPTGGGKTTTASLIARLYDPTAGRVMLSGRDIRSYTAEERTQKIGFILQDPFLFSGTVGENLLYGSGEPYDQKKLEARLKKEGLDDLLSRFDQGLGTPVSPGGETISLGQKQLIAFMRAVLRKPELLILDEATANVDTVTEQLLEAILERLPKETTKVVIAHRLNTISNADAIFFVNGGEVTSAGSLDHAIEMLSSNERVS